MIKKLQITGDSIIVVSYFKEVYMIIELWSRTMLSSLCLNTMQILESQLNSLRALSLKYEVMPLVKQCEEITERFKLNKKLFDSGKNVEISYPSSKPHCGIAFPSGLPLNMQRLKQFHITGEYSDVDIYIGGHGLVAPSHKIILSLWSVPFFKVC